MRSEANRPVTEPDVAIIGGGLAGLAAGVALADAGVHVQVFEATDALGGRARSVRDEATGDRVDIGPHIVLSEYRNFLRLLEVLGTRDALCWQGRRFITLVDEPRPVTIRTHRLPAPLHLLPDLLTAPQISFGDLLSNARLFWRTMRLRRDDLLALDALAADTYLARMHVSARFVDWFWRSAAMTIVNVPLERCSTAALLGFFRYMIGVAGFQVGLPGEALDALYAEQARAHIEARAGRVHLEATVRQLIDNGNALAGLRLADGSEVHARRCIVSVPPRELHALLPRAWTHRAELAPLGAIEPSPYVSVYLWFDRKLTQQRFWTKVYSPRTLNFDFYDLANIRRGWSGRGSLIASNIIYSTRIGAMSDADIVAATVRELGEYLPTVAAATLQHARVHRIPMAVPAAHPDVERARPAAKTTVEGLYLAGDWVDTGLPFSMESAVRAGWLAAEAVLADMCRPRTIASPLPEMEGIVRLVGGRAPR